MTNLRRCRRCALCSLLMMRMLSERPLCYSNACMWVSLCCLILLYHGLISVACPEDTIIRRCSAAAAAVTAGASWSYVPAELPERARNTPGDTGVILSVPLFATKLPWLVRESAPITTPPSNLAATSVVASTSPAAATSRASAAAAKADSIPLCGCQRKGYLPSSLCFPCVSRLLVGPSVACCPCCRPSARSTCGRGGTQLGNDGRRNRYLGQPRVGCM